MSLLGALLEPFWALPGRLGWVQQGSEKAPTGRLQEGTRRNLPRRGQNQGVNMFENIDARFVVPDAGRVGLGTDESSWKR